jgi:iron complex transport system ATP-binding protein
MLIAKNITVRLGKKPVLHGVDLSAKSGELTAIVGPNGSGKTTLLRAMTGDVAYGGSVSLGGVPVEGMAPWELATRRAVLPQIATLAFPFTVIEVVRLGLTAGRTSTQVTQIEHLPYEALAAVGLSGFEARFYQELSGGEQQRVQLARVMLQVWEPVLAGQARWLFLDEPVSSLDIGHQLEVMTLARNFARTGGGVIAVMHDLNLTAMFADSMALIHGGEVMCQGTPADVMTDARLSRAYGCALQVSQVPRTTAPFLLPQAASLP